MVEGVRVIWATGTLLPADVLDLGSGEAGGLVGYTHNRKQVKHVGCHPHWDELTGSPLQTQAPPPTVHYALPFPLVLQPKQGGVKLVLWLGLQSLSLYGEIECLIQS